MSDKFLADLDTKIGNLKQQLTEYESIRKVVADNPAIVSLVSRALSPAPESNGQPPAKVKKVFIREHDAANTRFARIAAFFDSVGNDWRRIAEVAEATKMTSEQVVYILKSSKATSVKFEKKRHDGRHGQPQWWRLKK